MTSYLLGEQEGNVNSDEKNIISHIEEGTVNVGLKFKMHVRVETYDP